MRKCATRSSQGHRLNAGASPKLATRIAPTTSGNSHQRSRSALSAYRAPRGPADLAGKISSISSPRAIFTATELEQLHFRLSDPRSVISGAPRVTADPASRPRLPAVAVRNSVREYALSDRKFPASLYISEKRVMSCQV